MTLHNKRYFWGPDVAAVLKIPNPDCTKCSGTGRTPIKCNCWDDDDN